MEEKEVIKLLKIFAEDNEHDVVTRLAKMSLNLIYRLQIENERLTEEKKSDAMLLYASCLACEQVNAENAELQKQVDELKEQRDVFKNLFENCNNSSISTVEIINAMNSFYREQTEHLAGLKIEQAVKDTAKEIANWLPTTVNEDKNVLSMIIKEHYGVEVE